MPTEQVGPLPTKKEDVKEVQGDIGEGAGSPAETQEKGKGKNSRKRRQTKQTPHTQAKKPRKAPKAADSLTKKSEGSKRGRSSKSQKEEELQLSMPVVCMNAACLPEDGVCWFCQEGADSDAAFGLGDLKPSGYLIEARNGVKAEFRFHEACSAYCSGHNRISFDGRIPMKDIVNEWRRGRKLQCQICRQFGAVLSCINETCRKAYHYTCARRAVLQEKVVFHSSDRAIACIDHVSCIPEGQRETVKGFRGLWLEKQGGWKMEYMGRTSAARMMANSQKWHVNYGEHLRNKIPPSDKTSQLRQKRRSCTKHHEKTTQIREWSPDSKYLDTIHRVEMFSSGNDEEDEKVIQNKQNSSPQSNLVQVKQINDRIDQNVGWNNQHIQPIVTKMFQKDQDLVEQKDSNSGQSCGLETTRLQDSNEDKGNHQETNGDDFSDDLAEDLSSTKQDCVWKDVNNIQTYGIPQVEFSSQDVVITIQEAITKYNFHRSNTFPTKKRNQVVVVDSIGSPQQEVPTKHKQMDKVINPTTSLQLNHVPSQHRLSQNLDRSDDTNIQQTQNQPTLCGQTDKIDKSDDTSVQLAQHQFSQSKQIEQIIQTEKIDISDDTNIQLMDHQVSHQQSSEQQQGKQKQDDGSEQVQQEKEVDKQQDDMLQPLDSGDLDLGQPLLINDEVEQALWHIIGTAMDQGELRAMKNVFSSPSQGSHSDRQVEQEEPQVCGGKRKRSDHDLIDWMSSSQRIYSRTRRGSGSDQFQWGDGGVPYVESNKVMESVSAHPYNIISPKASQYQTQTGSLISGDIAPFITTSIVLPKSFESQQACIPLRHHIPFQLSQKSQQQQQQKMVNLADVVVNQSSKQNSNQNQVQQKQEEKVSQQKELQQTQTQSLPLKKISSGKYKITLKRKHTTESDQTFHSHPKMSPQSPILEQQPQLNEDEDIHYSTQTPSDFENEISERMLCSSQSLSPPVDDVEDFRDKQMDGLCGQEKRNSNLEGEIRDDFCSPQMMEHSFFQHQSRGINACVEIEERISSQMQLFQGQDNRAPAYQEMEQQFNLLDVKRGYLQETEPVQLLSCSSSDFISLSKQRKSNNKVGYIPFQNVRTFKGNVSLLPRLQDGEVRVLGQTLDPDAAEMYRLTVDRFNHINTPLVRVSCGYDKNVYMHGLDYADMESQVASMTGVYQLDNSSTKLKLEPTLRVTRLLTETCKTLDPRQHVRGQNVVIAGEEIPFGTVLGSYTCYVGVKADLREYLGNCGEDYKRKVIGYSPYIPDFESMRLICTAWCYGGIFSEMKDPNIQILKNDDVCDFYNADWQQVVTENYFDPNWIGRPNVTIVTFKVQGWPVPFVVTIGKILKGEELRYIYGVEYWNKVVQGKI